MTFHIRQRGLILAAATARYRGMAPAGIYAQPIPPQGDNPAALLQELTASVGEFIEKHEKKYDDLQAAFDDLNRNRAASILGGEVGEPVARHSPEFRAARTAVVDYLRSGSTAGFTALNPQAAMSSDSDPNGGWMVPVEIDRVIQSQMVEVSPMRQMANVVKVGSQKYQKLINRRGATSGWVGEREERTETSSPVLGLVEPPIGEIYAQPEVTARLLDDNVFNLEAFLAENVSDEFALQEGEAYVSGNGINKPRGFLTYDLVSTADATRDFGKLQYVASGVAGGLSDVSNNGADKLIDLLTAVRPSYRVGPGVGWTMNSTTASVVQKLKDGEGRYLWQQSLSQGQPDRLLGFPVWQDEFMPDIGANAYPIGFGNWRKGYTIVDRSELTLLRDPYTKKGWVRFYFTKRVGGGVTDSNAIKLLKIATT